MGKKKRASVAVVVADLLFLPSDLRQPAVVARRASWWSQAATLMSRTLAVVVADPFLIAMVALMPALLALLAHIVPGADGLSVQAAGPSSSELAQRLTILTVGAALMGIALTIRELVREHPILLREHAVGLSASAYWFSKTFVFGILAFAQGALFAGLSLWGVRGPDGEGVIGLGKIELVVPVALATSALALTGLAISAVVRSSEQAMPALVGMVMVQLVLSGALLPVAGREILQNLAWLSPSRWAYAALNVATDTAARPNVDDPLYHHDATQWLLSCALLLAVTGVTVVVGQVLNERSARRTD